MPKIRLIQGDCLEEMDKLISEGVKVDAVISDVPYGTTACKWDSVIPFHQMWPRLELLRKDRTPIVLFGSEPFSSALRMSNIKEYKYDWIWEKSHARGFLNAWKQPLRSFEIMTVFYKKQCYYRPQLKDKELKNIRPLSYIIKISDCYGKYGLNIRKSSKNKSMPKNIIKFNNCQDYLHPNQKPLELIKYFIKTYTNEGALVLDFTMGSGQTMLACEDLNRNGIGIDNGYCEKEKSKYYKMPWKEVVEDRLKGLAYA